MSEKIELRLSNWLFNAALLGFYNILGGKQAEEKGEIEISEDGQALKFFPNVLENFEYKYFDFFLKRYYKILPYGKILSFEQYIDDFLSGKKENISSDEIEKVINEKIDFIKKTLKSNSYQSAYDYMETGGKEKILKLEKEIKKIKKPKENVTGETLQEIKETFNQLKEIMIFLKKAVVDEKGNAKKYPAAKNIIYLIVNNNWNGVSFLNRANAAKDVYEEYKSYFVNPVIEYINKEKSKFKYKCSISDMPMENYQNTLGFLNYTGFDIARKPSHVWNFNNDIAVTPLVTLIYSCMPAGFVFEINKGIFVNANFSFKFIEQINNGIARNIYVENQEDKKINLYRNLLKEFEVESNSTKYEIADIQVVRLEDETYRFSILSKNMLQLLNANKEKINRLLGRSYKDYDRYFNLYDETIRELLNNQNLFSLINRLCYYKISKNRYAYYNESNLLDLVKLNMDYIRRLKEMENKEEKKCKLKEEDVNAIKNNGYYFRKSYIEVSGNDKKIGSLLYRLQNSLRINNVDMFMYTLISAHAYAVKEINKLLTKALVDEEDFQTLGHAFLIGLLGERKNEDENKNIKEGNE